MCGRYVITSSPQEIRSYFGYREHPNFPPRYNIAPAQPVPIIRMNDGHRQFVLVHWGLIPSWLKEIRPSRPLINARAETLLEKPSFKHAARRRRCLLPLNGFYEWQKTGSAPPKPYLVRQKDDSLFALAGIWEHWQGANGSEIESAAIITTRANQTLAPIHHRMPVVLDRAAQERWLNTAEFSATEVYPDLKPAENDLLTTRRVSARVNKVANDDADLLESADEDTPEHKETQEDGNQLTLF